MSHDLLVQMNLDMMPWNSASGRFAYMWQRKWVGITAIKTQKTQIHFFSDLLVAVASLDLKVPIGVFLHVPSNSSRSLCESSLGPVSFWFLRWQIAAISAKAFFFFPEMCQESATDLGLVSLLLQCLHITQLSPEVNVALAKQLRTKCVLALSICVDLSGGYYACSPKEKVSFFSLVTNWF